MDEEEKQKRKEEKLQEIVDSLDRDVRRPPYDNNEGVHYSRQYQKYRESEEKHSSISRYEKLCLKAGGLLKMTAGERTQKKLSPAIRLLDYEITPGMVTSAAVLVGFTTFTVWATIFGLNLLLGAPLPVSLFFLMIFVPIAAGAYTYMKPVYDAQEKVIQASGEMILSVLYMVIYMRSSPNLEGAVRFAALNLDGPISDDLKSVLWKVEVGKFSSVSESLHEYTKIWKDYNDTYLQSLQMIEAAMHESNEDRRQDLLQDAIDSLLDGTKQMMKQYAQDLKMPVMILNAMGAMLPVLGMIMLPLISVFMGGVITRVHLVMLFNIMLPAVLFWLMKRLLSSRPPTTSTEPVDESNLPELGKYYTEFMGKDIGVPSWMIGLGVFLVVSAYGWIGYLIFPHWYPIQDPSELVIPSIFAQGDGVAPMPMLLRSVSITLGMGLGLGVTYYLGSGKRVGRKESLEHVEAQFPRALFQLGNKVSGGTPIEVALDEAAKATKQLEISGLFKESSRNIRELGMTFRQALFDTTHGALLDYPSRMINTVMKSILESSQKGTEMAAMTMITFSRYLDNIQQTQQELTDLLEDTTSTISMLSFLLAPVVSAVAVGMSQTIITAMFEMAQGFSGMEAQAGGDAGLAGAGIVDNLDEAIKPEMLQFVVGIYLIQLLYILGHFYIKITKGNDPAYIRNYTGKVLMIGLTFYSIVLVVVGMLFGGVVTSIAA